MAYHSTVLDELHALRSERAELKASNRRWSKVADERSKENCALRRENERLQAENDRLGAALEIARCHVVDTNELREDGK